MKLLFPPRPVLRRLAFLLCGWLLAGWAAPAARAQAPVFDQAAVCGQPASGTTYSLEKLAVDAAGNAYVTGYFSGSLLLGSTILTSRGSMDLFVARLDPAGAVQWAVQAGGPGDDRGSGICLDALGHVFVSGIAQGAARFGPLNLNTPALGSQRAIVARLDAATGAWHWLAQGGGIRNSQVYGLAADAAGHVFVSGSVGDQRDWVDFGALSATPVGHQDVFVARLDAGSGTWQWLTLGGGAGGTLTAQALALDGAGGVYVSGHYRPNSMGPIQLGAVTLPVGTSFNTDVFVAKLDAATGAWQWASAGGGADGNEAALALAVNGAGIVVVAGGTGSSAPAFGATTFVNRSGRGPFGALLSDGYAAGLNAATGAWQWAVQIAGAGDEICRDAATSTNGEIYLTGNFTSTAIFGSQTFVPTASSELFVARLDAATGSWRWVSIGGGRGHKRGQAVALTNSNHLYLGGTFFGAIADIGPATLAGSATEVSGFLARLPNATVPLTGQAPVALSAALAVWPSPAQDRAWVSGPVPGTPVQLLDALGRQVGAAIMPATGALALPLALPTGLYLVQAGLQTRKLLVD